MMVGLRRLLDETQIRRLRAEVLPDLPPKTGYTIDPGLLPSQRTAYDIAEHDGLVWLRELGEKVTVANILELLLRLKQHCNAEPQTGASGKLDDLERRVESLAATQEKALIFSQFVAGPFGVQAIATRLKRFAPLTLVGGQDAATRNATLAAFADNQRHQVLVLSLRAGGVGLNLTAASVVFHFDRWWTAAVEAQAEDRAHRMGQTRPVQVFTYVCADTVEIRIAEIIAGKQKMADLLVDGIDVEALAHWDKADLLMAAGMR
jgi:SNF2 family DNA or RNA helicase